MKKIAIIFASILISVFSMGSFLIYSSYLSSYQNAYQAFAKKQQLSATKISINPSQLYSNTKTITWEDDNNEVIVNGNLYDIVSVVSEKGKVVLTVLSDDQESEMKKEFASTYDVNSSKTSSTPIKLLKQFFSLKFLSDTDLYANVFSIQELKANSISAVAKLASVYLSLETPPPAKIN